MRIMDDGTLNDKQLSVNDLIERGKNQGSLTSSEIMEAFEDEDFDMGQMEQLYETLEGMDIDVDGNLQSTEAEEIENEVGQYESAEKMEKLLDMLEDNDDVSNVYHNAELPEEDEEE